jgi:hypothetical protein
MSSKASPVDGICLQPVLKEKISPALDGGVPDDRRVKQDYEERQACRKRRRASTPRRCLAPACSAPDIPANCDMTFFSMRQKISDLGDASLRARFVLVASGRSTNPDTANGLVTCLEGDAAGQNGHVRRVRERLRRERRKLRKHGQQLACHVHVEDRTQRDNRVSLSKAALSGMKRGVVASQYDLRSTGDVHNGRRHVVALALQLLIASVAAAIATLRGRLRPLKDTCACAGARDKKAIAPVSSAEKVIRIDGSIFLWLIERSLAAGPTLSCPRCACLVAIHQQTVEARLVNEVKNELTRPSIQRHRS